MSASLCPCFDNKSKNNVKIKYTYSKNYGSTESPKSSSSKKNRSNKKKNKPKEVTGWDDIDDQGNKVIIKEKVRRFIPPKYTDKEMMKMSWADLDDLTEEEAWGYFVEE